MSKLVSELIATENTLKILGEEIETDKNVDIIKEILIKEGIVSKYGTIYKEPVGLLSKFNKSVFDFTEKIIRL
jgi:hypothetical protein